MDEGILSDREGMQRFAEAVAAEIPVFRIYSNHVDFARRWILGGALPEDVQAPGVYIVLLYRGKGRFFHVGETDEATFGWVRELDDAFHSEKGDPRTIPFPPYHRFYPGRATG